RPARSGLVRPRRRRGGRRRLGRGGSRRGRPRRRCRRGRAGTRRARAAQGRSPPAEPGMTPAERASALVDADAGVDERAAEAALRPRTLDEFVGQERVREQLGLVLTAARGRGSPPDHVLLSGPPGLGKTTLAMIIGAELG